MPGSSSALTSRERGGVPLTYVDLLERGIQENQARGTGPRQPGPRRSCWEKQPWWAGWGGCPSRWPGKACWPLSRCACECYSLGMAQAGRTLGLEVDHDYVCVPYGYYCVCRNRALSAG